MKLDEIIEVCKAVEATSRYSQQHTEYADVDSAQASGSGYRRNQHYNQHQSRNTASTSSGKNPCRSFGQQRQSPYQKDAPSTRRGEKKYKCRNCRTWHEKRNCPAFGSECKNCGKKNHYTKVCEGNNTHSSNSKNNRKKKAVNAVEAMEIDSEDEDSLLQGGWSPTSHRSPSAKSEVSTVKVHMISTVNKKVIISGETRAPRKEYTEVLKIQSEHFVKFKLDPGSEINILPYKVFNLINRNYMVKPTNIHIKAYGNVITKPEGIVSFLVETQHGDKVMCDFLLSKIEPRPILGIEACDKLNLVKRVQHPTRLVNTMQKETKSLPDNCEAFKKMYPEQFSGLGQFKQVVKINVDPNAQPGSCPPRRYKFSTLEKLEKKLKDLEKTGIIAKVKDHIPKYVSNMLIREKANGDIRICLDPEHLNKAIIRQHYNIPTVEELKIKVKDKKIFTVLDLKDGFWHAALDEPSTELTCFSTPIGLYKFLKMPFGISSAPETFQFLTEQAFEGTGGVVYFDDILVPGENTEEHDRILKSVMEKAKEENIRFNPSKLQYRKPEVKFLGQLWSENSAKVDPERVRAMDAIKEPTTRTQLHKTMGTFNYLRSFIPQMGQIAAPLYQLLSPLVKYQWLPVHAEAFKTLKESVKKAPVLATFNSKVPIVIQADASQNGIGCVLLQNGQPVAMASRSLTETEKLYAQVEKELLALVFAAEKFAKYIWGMPNVLFHTDHQPLVSIFKKPMHSISNNRIKKLRLKMMEFNPVVEYLPGKHMHIADLLSRQFLDDLVHDDPEMLEVVHEVTMHIPMSPEIGAEFRQATAEDAGLSAVIQLYNEGWPNSRKKVPIDARPYWQFRNDLFAEDGLVIMGERIVVPLSLRRKVLKRLHKSHLGTEKTKLRARQILYWPGMSNDITTTVQQCRICERYSANNKREPLTPHQIPDLPFQKISVDILELDSKSSLVVEDNLSKWLEVRRLTSKSSKSVIETLRSIFATHGIPEIIFGDNNPLNSQECKEFAHEIGSTIKTSSPEYPRSNGLAEKGVHIAKQIMRKIRDDGTHLSDALLEYNNTPLSGLNISPAQILMSRRCRTAVPTLRESLKPKVVNVRPQLETRQQHMKMLHDKSAPRKAVSFNVGDSVAVRRRKVWRKGTIIEQLANKSYMVQMNGGRKIRRNTYHLKPSATKPDRHDDNFVDIEGIIEHVVASRVNTGPHTPVAEQTVRPPTAENNILISPVAGDRRRRSVSQEEEVIPRKRTRSGRCVKQPDYFGYSVK